MSLQQSLFLVRYSLTSFVFPSVPVIAIPYSTSPFWSARVLLPLWSYFYFS